MRKYQAFFRIRFINTLQYRSAAIAGMATQLAWGWHSTPFTKQILVPFP